MEEYSFNNSLLSKWSDNIEDLKSYTEGLLKGSYETPEYTFTYEELKEDIKKIPQALAEERLFVFNSIEPGSTLYKEAYGKLDNLDRIAKMLLAVMDTHQSKKEFMGIL